MKFTAANRAQLSKVKSGAYLQIMDIPRSYVFGERLCLHYPVKLAGKTIWIPAAVCNGLRRRGITVEY
jgi:hypothetical protein